ncbi:MAG: D-alanine--D-alanine ligase [Pseudomonadota bacterium]
MAGRKHVAVLLGGWAAERPVSLNSGAACASALERAGYQVTPVDVGRDIATVLSDLKPDVAFNALHGPGGEDGVIQGVLETLSIPYTHSGVLASALAMNKAISREIFASHAIPIATGRLVSREEAAQGHVYQPPYVLKPVGEGSSFGVFIVREDMEHPPQELHSADWRFGETMLAEKFVAGKELTCAVLGDRSLGVTEIVPTSMFYDYEAKYAEGGSRHVVPAPLKPKIYHEIETLAVKAHKALGCRGVTRADFRYDDRPDGSGALVCLEVNTQPGMTETSLVPELAQHAGMSLEELVGWMVEDASCDR